MRVFLAGATGVIGRRLIPLLLAAGHEVSGTTRSPAKSAGLRRAGADPVVVDALDGKAMHAAVLAAEPDAVIHQLTSLPPRIDPRKIERDFALNDRLRSEGTRILMRAARDAGVERIVAQSIAFTYAPGPADTLHRESDPLLTPAEVPAAYARTAGAVIELERSVGEGGGVVLRYGYFYGPGSSIASTGSIADDLRRRRMPIVGGGGGVWSFVHVDDAAAATVAALQGTASSIYNIVDDHPAPVADWLPALAGALGAPRPMRVPAWLARPLSGEYGVTIMTRAQGASNELARRELDWIPAYPGWREGFRSALG